MAEQPDRTRPETERDERTGKSAAAQRIARQQEWVDHQLRIAMERGDFDNLPGAGKPIKDLGAQHDPDWWIKRLVEREKITGVLPPALQLRKDDAELDGRARPAHRRVRGTSPARGVQRPRDEGALHPGRRPAAHHHAPRRRRRGGALARAASGSVARRPATRPPYVVTRPPEPRRAASALVAAYRLTVFAQRSSTRNRLRAGRNPLRVAHSSAWVRRSTPILR